MKKYKLAIIGSGPAGLSAGVHAAETGASHILLEKTSQLANTIVKFQKGKHVMDEPRMLPVRSPLPFKAGTRESVLDEWKSRVKASSVNVRYNAEVVSVAGRKGGFTLGLKSGEEIESDNVVLAIGLQGNPRKLGVSGEDLPFVQYGLDDPQVYEGETIVVAGAGDAAIENALALTVKNRVIIVNRRDEFTRAKQANLAAVLKAIETGQISCYYNTSIIRAEPLDEETDGSTRRGQIFLRSPEGELLIECHRLIARLGALPPRDFLNSLNIQFMSDDPSVPPVLSNSYESNIPGLYVIGSLGGYPLIKQAINQGYEVVETMLGRAVEPADEPILKEKCKLLERHWADLAVADALTLIQQKVPLLSGLTPLQLRDFLLDSRIAVMDEGQTVFRRNDYTDTFFAILKGEVFIETGADGRDKPIVRREGEFFGEMSLISGRRRSATVVAGADCVLIETPRRAMNRLINSVRSVKHTIDKTFMMRAIQTYLVPTAQNQELEDLVEFVYIQNFPAGSILFKEGEKGDVLHFIRRGSVSVSRSIGGREHLLSYRQAGNYIGEMAILSGGPRTATVRACPDTETICLNADVVNRLMSKHPELRVKLEKRFQKNLAEDIVMEKRHDAGGIMPLFTEQGVGEATDVLLIDESLCIHCDNCEKACAGTHFGVSRLRRQGGTNYASIRVPTSCRHCESPHCMKDCPPDAIHRAVDGEVFITDNCIGCGNCESNCPYGVIQIATLSQPASRHVFFNLLFGFGGKASHESDPTQTAKVAVKCDMCVNLPGGPACVRSCPAGAATRVSPKELINIAQVSDY